MLDAKWRNGKVDRSVSFSIKNVALSLNKLNKLKYINFDLRMLLSHVLL